MILSILAFILLIIILISFFNIRVGAALYLAYSILVPMSDITLGSFHIGDNVVRTIMLIALLYDLKLKHHYRLSWKLLLPFIGYYAIELFLIFFQKETPSDWMYNSWRVSVMNTLFDGFIVYNVISTYPNSIRLFRNSLVISILVAGLYGIILTTTGGLNPYIMSIMMYKGTAEDIDYFMNYFSTGDRLFGRISSVFKHPMTFGLFIGLAFVYIFSIRKKIKKPLLIFTLTILALDALFCGVRSCIGGLVVAGAIYLLLCRNIKIALTTLVIGLIAYNIILQMPDVSDYLGSITDIHNTQSNMNGSSIDMRLDQLNGCFDEIKDCQFIGKGYAWHRYYQTMYGDHPVILAFESLIFVALCDNGFLGIAIWIGLILLIIRNNHRFKLSDTAIADSLLAYYIAYSCITGEYGYMHYFILFYICLVFENLKDSNNLIINKKRSLYISK